MESLGKKKICILYAGGISQKSKFDAPSLKKWLGNFFELQMMAKIESHFIWHGQDQFIDWILAKQIATAIENNYQKFDGFVITHSLANILYTSSLLSFIIQNTKKPIIFTVPMPQEKGRVDIADVNLKASLINAIQVATCGVPEIGIVMGNHLVRANQAQLEYKLAFNCLKSYKNKYLAKIQFGIHLSPHVSKHSSGVTRFNYKYNSNIKILEYYPGFKIPANLADYDGIFVKGLRQKLPPDWVLPKDKPVYIYSYDLSPECAVAKFIWVLGQTQNLQKVNKIMAKNLAGEF